MGNYMLAVNQAGLESVELGSTKPVLVDFWAEWCSPCKMSAPIVSQIGEEFEARLHVIKVDAEAKLELMAQYGVTGLPTLLVFKGGRVIERIIAFQPKAELVGILAAHL